VFDSRQARLLALWLFLSEAKGKALEQVNPAEYDKIIEENFGVSHEAG
jgi:hypothetical protein